MQTQENVLLVGQRGALLIEGRRLWRSTTVTLAAQKADEITVLPNMGGSSPWTSEGVTSGIQVTLVDSTGVDVEPCGSENAK